LKIVFHDKYFDVYAGDPASAEGRLDRAYEILEGNFEFVQPETAREEDLLLVHSQAHVGHVERDTHLFEVASLAVGGAIRASEMALECEPAFGLIRPPGHHASPNSCWGFCYFNNIAIAIRRLIHTERIKRALIVDFDLHFGDGTSNTFAGDTNVVYYHMGSNLGELESFLSTAGNFDALAVSAGFDRGVADWGGTLSDREYYQTGEMLKHFSNERSQGRRFAILEGGYNHKTIGASILSFLEGFDS
jgi:acetoin utilization deacetylase AcuC-like enzyme